ncbi:ATP-binding cassette domain-containing protein [Halorientalis salina]|uniref:ATP-binding cassette domain-containing protein n=1 Tax=Halorientalis salina TaxID=2932266 RepID=UPI0010AB8009|nr:ABC transporter ATP-binding protein [Halorientalis salina]
MSVLELRDVTKTYGGVTALDSIDLTVEAGTFHCLVGPNGSGKTTLFRTVLGLTRPTSGSVSLPEGRVGCGFQRANVYRELTVGENLSVFGELMGATDDEWRDELVTTLRLDRVMDRTAADLSGGFAKKLDLALALLDKPDVLFLDEPLGDLDDVSKTCLLDFLGEYRDAGNAIVVSTHHLTDFDSLVDHLTVLYDGDIVVDADRQELDFDGHDSLQELYVDRVLSLERADEPEP